MDLVGQREDFGLWGYEDLVAVTELVSCGGGGRSKRVMIPRKDDFGQLRSSGTSKHWQLKINTVPSEIDA